MVPPSCLPSSSSSLRQHKVTVYNFRSNAYTMYVRQRYYLDDSTIALWYEMYGFTEKNGEFSCKSDFTSNQLPRWKENCYVSNSTLVAFSVEF